MAVAAAAVLLDLLKLVLRTVPASSKFGLLLYSIVSDLLHVEDSCWPHSSRFFL